MKVKELINRLEKLYDPEDNIAHDIWCVDDVIYRYKDLDKEQAIEVIELMDSKLDATIGLNWTVMDCAVDEIKGVIK